MNRNKANQELENDIERIYLGNLSTIEADIILPLEGQGKTKFTWESSHEYLLSSQGKVNRPHFGAGNREVTLTLTATNEDAVATKKFTANILEKEYPSRVEYAYPITVYTKRNTIPQLPAVAVVRNDLKEDAVIPVQWEEITGDQVLNECTFKVLGSVKDSVAVTASVIVTDDTSLITPIKNIKKQILPFSLNTVTLKSGSDFYNQQQRLLTCLLHTNDETMLYNFRVIAGISTNNAKPMTGWDAPECKLKGHTTGHYLSGLALCYSATKNEEIKQKLDYMVSELFACQKALAQQPDRFKKGFLSAYDESQFDLLEEYTTYPTIWAPYYTLHKIVAGLRDCYIHGGNHDAFEILKGVGLWIYNRLSALTSVQRDKMWAMYIAGEFGGINETLADLYIITGEDKYLTASKFFDNEKLYLPMKMKIDALGNLHANQHIPQIIGCLRQFDACKEQERFEIANTFWDFVTGSHIYTIGGTGETEMFKPAGQIAKFISEKTAESCASYNMLKLTGMLYEYNTKAKYMHYYENTVTNHILSSGDITGPTGASTYFMPTNPGGKKECNFLENSCCHGTGLESHFKYGEYIYAYDEESVFVNLFISSTLKSENISLSLDSEVKNDSIKVKIKATSLNGRSLKIRKPLWASSSYLTVNTKKVELSNEGEYHTIEMCEADSVIEITFNCDGYIRHSGDDSSIATVCWGPYVLAAISPVKGYINFNIDDENIKEKLIHKGNLEFTLDGHRFIPLCKISHEEYHIYIKAN